MLAGFEFGARWMSFKGAKLLSSSPTWIRKGTAIECANSNTGAWCHRPGSQQRR
jgi:hypothetical protein